MGDFRNSTRFSRGGGNGGNGGGQSQGYNRGGSRPASNNGGNGGGYQSRGGAPGRSYGNQGGGDQGGQQEGNFPFTRIAGLTVPKSASDEILNYVHNELKGSEIQFNAKVYLGKNGGELVLKNGDMLLISFKPSKNAKDFEVGKISVKN